MSNQSTRTRAGAVPILSRSDRTHLELNKGTEMDREISNRASPSAKLVKLLHVGGLHHRYKWSDAA